MPTVKVTALKPGQPRLAAFYEATAFNTLRALWRPRLMIVSILAAGVAVAVAAIIIPKRYTAEAAIQLDFAAREGAAPAQGATIDAAILVEGEARILRSPTLARQVVTRLKLEENPAYTSVGLVAQLLRHISPLPPGAPGVSKADIAAAKLVKQVQVSNDPRSYLINVSIVSNSPEWSATLANAFATEYLRHRIMQQVRQAEARVAAALQEARAFYGEKHPTLIQAKTQLEAAEARIREQEALRSEQVTPPPGHAYLKAEPVWLPSGPNPVAFMGMGVVGSLFAAVALALLLERRNTSLRSVVAETGIRCVGMIPKRADRGSADRKLEQHEAFRSLCLTLGLTGQSGDGARTMMITSALPAKAKTLFVKGLAAALTDAGKRVLIIDLVESRSLGKSVTLDDVIYNPALIRDFLKDQEDKPISELGRKSGSKGARNPLTSLAQAVSYLAAQRDLSAVVVRLFNVVGPGETNPHLLPEIVAQLKADHTTLRLGNLWPKRDYIHVRDAARGVVAAALKDDIGTSGTLTVNLGTSHPYSVAEIVEKLRQVAPIQFTVEEEQARLRKVDRPHLAADIGEISRRFGWMPQATVDDALADLWREPDFCPALEAKYR